jgi:hypothetical protein
LTNGATQVRWHIAGTLPHCNACETQWFVKTSLGRSAQRACLDKRLSRQAQDKHSETAVFFAHCVQVFLGTHLVPGVPEEAREVSERKLTFCTELAALLPRQAQDKLRETNAASHRREAQRRAPSREKVFISIQ